MERQESFEHAFKIDQAVQQHGQDGGAGYPAKPSEHQSGRKHLSNDIKIILHMDEGSERCRHDDRDPGIAGRAMPAAKQKAAKERFFSDRRHHDYC